MMFQKQLHRLKRIRLDRSDNARFCVNQAAIMFSAYAALRFTPLECYLYGFLKQKRSRKHYISTHWIETRFRKKLNAFPYVRILKDKLAFHYACKKKRLPVLKVHGFFHPVSGFSVKGGPLRNVTDLSRLLRQLAGSTIVAKPRCSIAGKGMTVFKVQDKDMITDLCNNAPLSVERFHQQMLQDLNTRQAHEDSCLGFILQEHLPPHPSLNPLNGKALNTVRIATLRDINGKVHPDFAMLRVARPGAMTDNLHKGAMLARVDLLTGRIQGPFLGYENQEGPWVEKKPDIVSDLFPDQKIFQWEEMLDTAIKFHETVRGVNSIGWDVAPAHGGPKVVEGNDNWDMVIAQVLEGPYLTPKRREILKNYGVF